MNTSYQKLPFGPGDYPDKRLYHQAPNNFSSSSYSSSLIKRCLLVLYIRTERIGADRGCDLETGSSRVSEQAPQRTASISPRWRRGSQVHRAGEALQMVPSAARTACIARAACTSLDHSNKETFRNRVVPWVGFEDYIFVF